MDSKVLIAAGATALVVAGIGLYSWLCGDGWEKDCDVASEGMNKAYNDAIAEFPSDRNKCKFRFEAGALHVRETHELKWGKDPRFAAWAKQYDESVKAHVKAMRKA